ncbi:MAG: hypothetical protein D6675_07440 [Gemmatimonadetes bacterium]|nr:MAG: hypothetical protein D6675_07440 [Gemmatimonadota bacterium]
MSFNDKKALKVSKGVSPIISVCIFVQLSLLVLLTGCENRDTSPAKLTLTATPTTVYDAGGDSVYAEVFATLRDGDNQALSGETVIFRTDIGEIQAFGVTDNTGQTSVTFSGFQTNPPVQGVKAIVEGWWDTDPNVKDTVGIYIYPSPNQ